MSLGYIPIVADKVERGGMSAPVVNKTVVLGFLSAYHDKVAWKGGRFAVKDTTFFRVDMADFISNETMGSVNIKVKRQAHQNNLLSHTKRHKIPYF